MSKDLQIGIIERVKQLLQIKEDHSPLELIQLLRKYKLNFHPDKFTDQTAQNEAKEEFVKIEAMISELDSFIQQERLHKSPMEIALYEPLYDNAELQTKLENTEKKCTELTDENNSLKEKVKGLEEQRYKEESDIIEEKKNELIELYKPSKSKVFSFSIVLVLSGLIPLLTRIEKISTFIKSYAPFSTEKLDIIMFIIFCIIIFISILDWLQLNYVKKKIAEIRTPYFYTKFFESLGKEESFSENYLFNYIYGKRNRLKRFLFFLGIRLFNPETIDYYKDVLINTLLLKQLIEISYADSLDRTFKIIKKPKYSYRY